jgi:hypothetical protein
MNAGDVPVQQPLSAMSEVFRILSKEDRASASVRCVKTFPKKAPPQGGKAKNGQNDGALDADQQFVNDFDVQDGECARDLKSREQMNREENGRRACRRIRSVKDQSRFRHKATCSADGDE